MADTRSSGNQHPHWRALRRHPRFMSCGLLFVVLSIGLGFTPLRAARGVLLAFDLSALIFLGTTVVMFARSGAQQIRQRARKEDEGYWGFLMASAGVSLIALVALGVELHASKAGGAAEIAIAACSLVLAWLFLNTIFALHYAHEYYGDFGHKDRGLDFPGTRHPDYWDFVYFAFVLGMTFQVSDVQISDRKIRHVATAHSLIAFFFNVIIVALSVNVVAGRM